MSFDSDLQLFSQISHFPYFDNIFLGFSLPKFDPTHFRLTGYDETRAQRLCEITDWK